MTSFRTRLLVGSLLWTVGVVLVLSVLLVLFFATHPQPHVATFRHFMAVPLAVSGTVGLASLVAGGVTIRRGLAAMEQVRARLGDVHAGTAWRLEGRFPKELAPLVADLNALLDARDDRIARAGTRAADLAHALKTPLAVLSHDADRVDRFDATLANSIRHEVTRMARQVDVHLSQARVSAAGAVTGLRTPVGPSVDGVCRALDRIHADRLLALERIVPADLHVRCTADDLDEMLGNLLDNACKWGRQRVQVSAARTGANVVLVVDDDGDGVEEALRPRILQRGVRADQRVPGTGLGLAIASDLAEAYDGSLTLDASPLGGLRVTLTLPAAGA